MKNDYKARNEALKKETITKEIKTNGIRK